MTPCTTSLGGAHRGLESDFAHFLGSVPSQSWVQRCRANEINIAFGLQTLARRLGSHRNYSVFVFCSGSTLDLSGRAAATSSIFPNCHGKRDGYKNGRMSKPVRHVSTLTTATLNQSTHGCHRDCTPPGSKSNEVLNEPQRSVRTNLRRGTTA